MISYEYREPLEDLASALERIGVLIEDMKNILSPVSDKAAHNKEKQGGGGYPTLNAKPQA